MDDRGELVSVIVPVYKVEEYLRECIDSIIGQTYKNLEIILVDDGSPDNCGEICEEYARNDRRITVYHKENGGTADARNYGIVKSNGEYLTFVDSDDVIKANFVETLMRLIHKYDAEIATASFMKFNNSVDWESGEIIGEYCLSPHDIFLDALYQRKNDYNPWARIYRRDTFSNIEFPKGVYFEDAVTTYKAIFKSTRIALTDEKMYGYRMRQGSKMKAEFSPKMLHAIPAMQEYCNAVVEKFPDLKAAASSRAFSLNRSVYLNFPFSRRKERMLVWAEMKKYRRAIIFDPQARKRERIAALLSYLGADLFHILLSWLYRKQQMRA